MHETGRELFNLMFRPGETVCVSHNKYGFHSIPLENAINGPITLVPPDPNRQYEHPESDNLLLVALNPIKGFRLDVNCTAFRNFLVEIDVGSLQSQLAYVKKIGLPYSAVIFSGNKSLHFLTSLNVDLPSENAYRKISEWILNIVTLADQNTKNPSRGIRIPGAYREPEKRQQMVELKDAVKLTDLITWLNKYPECKPKPRETRKMSANPDFDRLKPWAIKILLDAPNLLKSNRNKTWFSLAVEFALAGYSEEDAISILEEYFVEDRDFKKREWLTTIRSGMKYAYQKYK